MTRLREALERAKAGDLSTTPSLGLMTPARGSEGASHDAWDFDSMNESPVASPTRSDNPTEDPVDEAADSLPPLATRMTGSDKLVVLPNADVTLVEQFRRLAAALHHAKLKNDARTVMIASAVEAEGKTLTATNLALTLSESYQRRVLLIDADLRRPCVHKLFRLDNTYGLSDTLKHVVPDGKLPIHRVSRNLWIIPGGTPDSDPMSGLTSDTMRQLLEEAVEQFDWVVVDTPPVVLLPDANLLAAMIDTALLVVRANSTPYALSARAVEAIGPERILGVVLNRAMGSDLSEGGYYYAQYRYSYGREEPRKPSRFSRFRFGRKSER